MGFDEGQIVLDSPNGTYYSGQAVSGKLIFTQEKVKTFRGIYVKLKGFCKVHWTTTETRTVNGKSQTYTKSHDSHEEYINIKAYLVGGESGDHTINPGTYEYHFRFILPVNCPSSFEGQYGHVRYEIKAVVDRSFKFDQEKKVAVRVMAPMDLNIDPYCRSPLELEFQDSYCCCCMGSGSADTTVKLPVSGYCPGQTIPIELTCSNRGNVEIDYIKMEITKKLTFTATHHPGTRTTKDTVAEIKKGSIPSNTSRNWTVEMLVPALDVYNLDACQYIDVEYKFKVTINPDGCHTSTDGSQRIVIGTIPLVGFQDNIQNPLIDQMPKLINTAVTQQPMPSLPTVSPYPTPQFPPVVDGTYPNTASPYPPTASPYPNTGSPYPPTASPYPPTASPYPAPMSPYLPTTTPYSNNTSPFPNTALPYPPTSSPYPNKSPYPPGNPISSPYPDNPPPYPGNNQNKANNSPYPTTNLPYPTGNTPYQPRQEKPVGFQAPGAKGDNEDSSQTTAVPSAYPPFTNPYASASAPALDSPDKCE